MDNELDRELEERLVRYARIDTQSDEKSSTAPSTEIQLDLLNLLVDELNDFGAQDVRLTAYGATVFTALLLSYRFLPSEMAEHRWASGPLLLLAMGSVIYGYVRTTTQWEGQAGTTAARKPAPSPAPVPAPAADSEAESAPELI